MKEFFNIIEDLELINPPFLGVKYTWLMGIIKNAPKELIDYYTW